MPAKVREDEADAQDLTVLLGPNFPDEITGPHVVSRPEVTVVSFGTEYEMRLPTATNSWSVCKL